MTRFIDETTYDFENNDCIELKYLALGLDCTARLIVNPDDPESYATDVWVAIDDIQTPKKRRFLSWFTDQRIAVSFLVIDTVGDASEDSSDQHYIKEDGTLYISNKLLGGVLSLIGIHKQQEIERGYLLFNGGDPQDKKKPRQTAPDQLVRL